MSTEKPKSRTADATGGRPPVTPRHDADRRASTARRAAPEEDAPPQLDNVTGRVKFDERGNAIWEWSMSTAAIAARLPGSDPVEVRMSKLDNPELSLADDAPTPVEVARPNPKGAVHGYSPYDSGLLVKPGETARPPKRDLRRLSEWMKLRQQANANKRGKE